MKFKKQRAMIIAYLLCQLSFLVYSNDHGLSISYQFLNINSVDNEIMFPGNSKCFESNKSIKQIGFKDSLAKMPYHSIYIEAFDYNSIFSVNYENSMINFNRIYIIPRIGLNFVPFAYDKKLTAYTLFVNSSFQLFNRFFIDAGVGFSQELGFSPRMFPLGHIGIKYIGKRGLFLRISYLECLEPYINIGSIEYYRRQVDFCIGYSFGRKKTP